jgi:hypothetical protein
MTFDVSWAMVAIGLLVIVSLWFIIKSLKMPPSFFKNKEEREKLRKKLKDKQLEP